MSTVTERYHLGQCTLQFLENIAPAMEQLANWSTNLVMKKKQYLFIEKKN